MSSSIYWLRAPFLFSFNSLQQKNSPADDRRQGFFGFETDYFFNSLTTIAKSQGLYQNNMTSLGDMINL
jgi:hypothetical protein